MAFFSFQGGVPTGPGSSACASASWSCSSSAPADKRSSTLAAQARDEANFAALHAWIASHLDDNLGVAACRALESSTLPLKAICQKVGYAEEQTLRRVFLRNVGVNPLQYRARFPERAGV
ncbi:hypothetical protein INH39_15350 [Massilia violaceinigra]|uniref:HTH araC/xylS-type domain-containing protein n=1 Tax=Massilia violaceinigra TaxID=2045208 RepID=A0ABY4AE91_9BURK|nr:hypothetical protein [Massilia violaceinigra]UOD32907.1 hypothetical protein INH39_15350 [Massilia violaceinigra]